MPRLIFVATVPAAFELGPRTIVGRGADSTVQLSDQIISRHHLLIEARGPELLGKEFALEELPAAHLKGKEQPQRIFSVSRARG